MTSDDPRLLLDREPMTRQQWLVVATMVLLNALDGFDVLSISFASPGIAAEWGIDRAALGVVLSMELIGMALGAIVLGRVADRIGRRATILGCLVVMAAGMLGASTSHTVLTLSLWRVFTGLGIGGMLAATNAAVAEAANAARRSFCVVLMATGYPLGTIVGGSVATWLLGRFDWPAVFLFGASVALLLVPVVLWAAPESIAFLIERRPADALARVNAGLVRLGHQPVDRLPDADVRPARSGVAELFGSTLRARTVLLTLAYLAHIMTFYFILKWIPKIVADMGFAPASAGGVLVWASVGGAAGALVLGLLSNRVQVGGLTIGAMVAAVVMVVLFGQAHADLRSLSLVAACAGCATNAGVVGLYAMIAEQFPARLRGSATGVIIGVGRGGSALAPAVAGVLFAAGLSLPAVAALMALGSGTGALFLALLRVVSARVKSQ